MEQFATHPAVPIEALCHPTSLIGFIAVFFQAIILIAIAYYFAPLYFQAAKGQSAILSGVYILPISVGVTACSVISGVIIAKLGTYKMTNVRVAYLSFACSLNGLDNIKRSRRLDRRLVQGDPRPRTVHDAATRVNCRIMDSLSAGSEYGSRSPAVRTLFLLLFRQKKTSQHFFISQNWKHFSRPAPP